MDTSAFIPMSETGYYMLVSLMKERHGYGIIQHVEKITGGRIVLGAGTIYGTLVKFEKSGLVVMSREEEKRKYYKITALGEALISQEIKRLEELLENGKVEYENGKKQ